MHDYHSLQKAPSSECVWAIINVCLFLKPTGGQNSQIDSSCCFVVKRLQGYSGLTMGFPLLITIVVGISIRVWLFRSPVLDWVTSRNEISSPLTSWKRGRD